MKKRTTLILVLLLNLFLVSLILFGSAWSAQAASCQTLANGLWSDPAIWNCNQGVTIPDYLDDVTIAHQVLIDQAAASRHITITGILSGYENLNVTGDWIITEEGFFIPGNATVTFDGEQPQIISGESVFYVLDLANPTDVIAEDVLTVLEHLWINGSFFTNDQLLDLEHVTINQGELIASGVISVSGNWTNNDFFQPGINEVVFDGQYGDQIISGDGLDFYNLLIANSGITGAVVLEDFMEVANAITVTQGAFLDIGNNNISFGDENTTFVNLGSLRETTSMNGSPQTPAYVTFTNFLEGSFLGGSISTTSNLGEVSFRMQSNAQQCTTNEMDPHALRCFEITTSITQGIAATVRLYVHSSELNGIALEDLRVFRFDDRTGWEELTNPLTGTVGGGYYFAQGDTPGFSTFLLAPQNDGPTAVSLSSLAARGVSSGDRLALLFLGIGLVLFFSIRLFRLRRF